MGKRITANLAVWLMFVGIASFWIVYFIFGQVTTVEIASGFLLGGCVMLGLSWLPTAVVGVSKGARGGAEVLALGLFSIGFFGSIRQSWTQVYRYLDRPEWMLNHWSYPLILWSVFWAIFITILAPGTQDGDIPTANKIYLVIAGMIGMLIAGIAIGLSLAQSVV